MRFVIDNTIGYTLNRCAILLRIELAQRFRDSGYDITPEEWIILNRLWQKDGRSQNELAETTIKDKTTVTRLLDRMERKALVVRRSSTEDARVKEIYLTPNSQALQEVLIPIAKELLMTSVSNVDKSDLEVTISVLKTIEQNLSDLG